MPQGGQSPAGCDWFSHGQQECGGRECELVGNPGQPGCSALCSLMGNLLCVTTNCSPSHSINEVACVWGLSIVSNCGQYSKMVMVAKQEHEPRPPKSDPGGLAWGKQLLSATTGTKAGVWGAVGTSIRGKPSLRAYNEELRWLKQHHSPNIPLPVSLIYFHKNAFSLLILVNGLSPI